MAQPRARANRNVVEPEVFARIRERQSRLSPAKLAVAEYLMAQPVDAALCPAARLASAVGVSESVVVRLAGDLGYDGFPALQEAIKEVVRNRLSAGGLPDAATATTADHAVARVLHNDMRLLQAVMQANTPDAFEAAGRLLLAARQIVVAGLRMAHAVAVDLGFRLQLVLGNASVIQLGADTLQDELRRYGRGDVAILVDFRPYNPLAAQLGAALLARGVRTVALTDSLLAPVTQGASVTLLTPTEGDFGNNRSLTGASALVNCLHAVVFEHGADRCEASMRETVALRLQFLS